MPRLRRTRSHSRYDFRVRRVDQNRRTFRRPHYHFRKRRVQGKYYIISYNYIGITFCIFTNLINLVTSQYALYFTIY